MGALPVLNSRLAGCTGLEPVASGVTVTSSMCLRMVRFRKYRQPLTVATRRVVTFRSNLHRFARKRLRLGYSLDACSLFHTSVYSRPGRPRRTLGSAPRRSTSSARRGSLRTCGSPTQSGSCRVISSSTEECLATDSDSRPLRRGGRAAPVLKVGTAHQVPTFQNTQLHQ